MVVKETSYTPLPVIRNFVESFLQDQPVSTRMRQAVVDGISGGNVSIKLGGSDIIIPNVRRLASYMAKIGDTVWVAQTGPDLLVVGKVAISNVPERQPIAVAEVISGTAAVLTLNVPAGLRSVRVVGNGRSNTAAVSTSLRLTLNGVTTGGTYRSQRTEVQGTAAPGSGAGLEDMINVGYVAGDTALFGTRGWLDLLVTNAHTTRPQFFSTGGAVVNSTDADSRLRWAHGVAGGGPVTTIQLRPAAGSFVAGTYYELFHS